MPVYKALITDIFFKKLQAPTLSSFSRGSGSLSELRNHQKPSLRTLKQSMWQKRIQDSYKKESQFKMILKGESWSLKLG